MIEQTTTDKVIQHLLDEISTLKDKLRSSERDLGVAQHELECTKNALRTRLAENAKAQYAPPGIS